jgi:hypothetical protein
MSIYNRAFLFLEWPDAISYMKRARANIIISPDRRPVLFFLANAFFYDHRRVRMAKISNPDGFWIFRFFSQKSNHESKMISMSKESYETLIRSSRRAVHWQGCVTCVIIIAIVTLVEVCWQALAPVTITLSFTRPLAAQAVHLYRIQHIG